MLEYSTAALEYSIKFCLLYTYNFRTAIIFLKKIKFVQVFSLRAKTFCNFNVTKDKKRRIGHAYTSMSAESNTKKKRKKSFSFSYILY